MADQEVVNDIRRQILVAECKTLSQILNERLGENPWSKFEFDRLSYPDLKLVRTCLHEAAYAPPPRRG